MEEYAPFRGRPAAALNNFSELRSPSTVRFPVAMPRTNGALPDGAAHRAKGHCPVTAVVRGLERLPELPSRLPLRVFLPSPLREDGAVGHRGGSAAGSPGSGDPQVSRPSAWLERLVRHQDAGGSNPTSLPFSCHFRATPADLGRSSGAAVIVLNGKRLFDGFAPRRSGFWEGCRNSTKGMAGFAGSMAYSRAGIFSLTP